MIESAERELNRILVTFDSPAENQRIREEEVLIRGLAKASAGIRRVAATIDDGNYCRYAESVLPSLST